MKIYREGVFSLLMLTISSCGGGQAASPPYEPSPPISNPPPSPQPTPANASIIIGAQVDPAEAARFCPQIRADNNEATSLWVRWGEIPRPNGRYDWTQLDEKIEAYRSCGLEVALHVQSRLGQKRDYDPSQLDEPGYLQFLDELVSRYRNRVSRYSVENEAVLKTSWDGEPDLYFALLDAAYAVIKAADPDALVLESGIPSGSLGYLMVDDLYRAGRLDEALALADRVRANIFGAVESPPEPMTQADLARMSTSPDLARKRRWIELLRQHQNSFDVLQIHFYGDWEILPGTMRWVKALGISKPIEVWELSKRRPSNHADDQRVADDLVKLIAIAAGEGSQFSLFFNYVDWQAPGGFFPGMLRNSGTPRAPIQSAFRVLTEHITDAVRATPLDLAPGVWGYTFIGARPSQTVHVLWSSQPTTVSLTTGAGAQARLMRMDGSETLVDRRSIPVSSAPIILGQASG